MGRQFIAIVPEGPKDNGQLIQLVTKFKRTTQERGQEVRWVSPDLWHVTIQFLGEINGSMQSERLKLAFDDLMLDVSDFKVRLQGVGAFPSSDAARVLWIGVQESQAFLDLQSTLELRLKDAGLLLGEKEFRPHMTLGRFRNPMNVADLLKLGGHKHFGDYSVRELILFESVLQGNIIKYVPVARKPLTS